MKLHLQDQNAKGTPLRSFVKYLCAFLFFIPATSLLGQFIYVETFQDTNAEQWILGSESGSFTPVLTADAGIDTDGDGWLRLTTNGANQSNYAYLNSPIPSAGNTIDIEFEYTVHGGSGADGITFFMFDADVAFDTGAFGGSLGYANRDDSTPLSAGDGMAGGYFGLGFDTWGNYSNSNEGRNGGPGFLPDEVAVRGNGSGQTGYSFIEGTGDGTNPTLGTDLQFSARPVTGGATEDNFFGVRINISETSILTVSMEFVPGDGYNELFAAQLTGTRPDELMLGYTASTGGANNFHEVREFSIETTVQPVGAQFWDSDVNNNWDDTSGSDSNWVSDGQPADWADIFFGDDYGTGAETVQIEIDRKVRSINFDNPSDYTIDGGNGDNFEMDAPDGGTVTINVSDANYTGSADNSITHEIDVPITLLDDLTITNITDSADLILDGNFTTNNNDITVNTTGKGTVTLDSNISGTGGITKQGTGTLIMSDDDIDFSGDFDIDAGKVQIIENSTVTLGRVDGNDNYAGSGDINLASGATLEIDNTAATNRDIILGGDLTSTNGIIDFNAGDDIRFEDGTTQIDGGTVDMVARDEIRVGDGGDTPTVNVTSGTVNLTAGSAAGDFFAIRSGATWNQTGGTTTIGGRLTDIDGTLTVNNAQMNINTTDGADFNGTVTVNNNGKIDVANDLNISGGTLTGGSGGTVEVGGDLTVDGAATLSNDPNITMDGTGARSIVQSGTGSSITGIGTLEIASPAGSDFTTIDSTVGNLEANEIVITKGTLLLGADNQIDNSTPMELAGGYFSTAGFDDTLDTLTLSADSAIDVNGGNSTLTFADSTSESWTASTMLTITNWDGIFNDGGGNDQIRFGAGGLDASQVGQIYFLNPKGEDGIVIQGFFSAKLLPSGEIVPVMIPEPSTYFGGFMILGVAGLHLWQRHRRLQRAS